METLTNGNLAPGLKPRAGFRARLKAAWFSTWGPLRFLTFLLALPVLGLTACGGGEAPREAQTPPAAIAVKVATLEPQVFAATVQAPGSLVALSRVSPGTKILGRVERVVVKEGDRVRRGQLLAKLESRDLEAALGQARSGLAMAEARLDNARAQRDRMSELHGRGSATEKGLEDAVAAFRIAEATVAKAQADIAAARVQLDYAAIRSPRDGWVVKKSIEPGDMATPGAPLFVVEDLSQLEAVVRIPEADVAGIAPGAKAQVEVLGKKRSAVIDRIVPASDPASRTFELRLVLDNPDGILKSGMFARVSLDIGQEEVLSLPTEALVHRGQLTGTYIVGAHDHARLRWIKIGRELESEGETRVEILSGLKAGERFVVSPPPGLTDGAPVIAQASSGAAGGAQP